MDVNGEEKESLEIEEEFVLLDTITPTRVIESTQNMNDVKSTQTSSLLRSSSIFKTSNYQQFINIQKYEKIIQNYKNYSLNQYEEVKKTKINKKMRQILRCGIPNDELRRSLWQKIVESDELSTLYPNLYKKLYSQEDKFNYTPKILKDVRRTFPQFEYFQDGNSGYQIPSN
jgi:hypothetical protein